LLDGTLQGTRQKRHRLSKAQTHGGPKSIRRAAYYTPLLRWEQRGAVLTTRSFYDWLIP
jgi:hypothetical protein